MADIDDETQLLRVLLWRRKQPYDGVLGMLPEWVPENFHRSFLTTRDALLRDKYTPDDIQRFMIEIADMERVSLLKKNRNNPPVFHCETPVLIFSAVRVLARLHKAIQLGPKQGLASLTDTDHAEIFSRGKSFQPGRRKGALKKTTQYLLDLVSRYQNTTSKELFRIACAEAKAGSSPFKWDHADGGILLDDDAEVDLEKFSDRISKAKNRHMR